MPANTVYVFLQFVCAAEPGLLPVPPQIALRIKRSSVVKPAYQTAKVPTLPNTTLAPAPGQPGYSSIGTVRRAGDTFYLGWEWDGT